MIDGKLAPAEIDARFQSVGAGRVRNIVDILERDFRKIGYCADPNNIPDPSKSILSATAHSISFIADLDKDGKVDTLEYYVGLPTSLTSTPNPRDMLLYRVVNHHQVQSIDIGLTKFDFLYFDAQQDSLDFPIATASAIYSIRLSILLESSHAYDSLYAYAYWRQLRLAAVNLKNR